MNQKIVSLLVIILLLFTGMIGFFSFETEEVQGELHSIEASITFTWYRIYNVSAFKSGPDDRPPNFYYEMNAHTFKDQPSFPGYYNNLGSKKSSEPIKKSDGNLMGSDFSTSDKTWNFTKDKITLVPDTKNQYCIKFEIHLGDDWDPTSDTCCDVSKDSGNGQIMYGGTGKPGCFLMLLYNVVTDKLYYHQSSSTPISKQSGGFYHFSGADDGSNGKQTAYDCAVQFYISDDYTDDTPPNTTCTLKGDFGKNDWYKSDVNITFNATDNSGGTGVWYTRYKLNDTKWQSYNHPFNFTEEGDFELTYYSSDSNNVEAEKNVFFKIDRTPPEILTVNDSVDGWSKDNTPLFTWVFFDNTSGISHYFWNYNSGSDTQTTEDSVTLPVKPDGIHVLNVKAEDFAGNIGEYGTHEFRIDTTPPLPFDPELEPSGWTNGDPVLTFNATDEHSGIDHFEVNVGSGFVTETSPLALTQTSDGNKEITVRAYDRVGHFRDETVNVKIDRTPPNSFTPEVVPSTWTNTVPVLKFSTTDTLSGIDRYEADTGSGFETAASPLTLVEMDDGVHKVKIRAYDRAGNIREEPASVYIDKKSPEDFTVTAVPETWTKDDPEIKFSTTDALSGMGHYEVDYGKGFDTVESPFTVKNLDDGTHEVLVRAFDKAGNYAESSVFVYVDKNQPGVTDSTPSGTKVPLDSQITVTFTEPMDTDTVEDAFSIDPQFVGKFVWSEDEALLTFIPDLKMDHGTTYSVTITIEAKDLAGNSIPIKLTWDFTTVIDDGDITEDPDPDKDGDGEEPDEPEKPDDTDGDGAGNDTEPYPGDIDPSDNDKNTGEKNLETTSYTALILVAVMVAVIIITIVVLFIFISKKKNGSVPGSQTPEVQAQTPPPASPSPSQPVVQQSPTQQQQEREPPY